jgi:hypothetical protein
MDVSGQLHVSATGERAPYAHWVGSSVGVDAVENRKISFPCPESKPDSSAVQLEARDCTKWAEVI